MEKIIKVQKSIYELLQEVRYELSKKNLSKSGHNSFQNFDYFELKDFVPEATELFKKKGMCPMFNISWSDGIEYASLEITRGLERILFRVPTAEPAGNNPIQNLGSKITYLRRYLYLIALDLVENDTVDASDNSTVEKKSEPKATKDQLDIITSLYDAENLESILKWAKIEKLSDLSVKQASVVIAKKKGK